MMDIDFLSMRPMLSARKVARTSLFHVDTEKVSQAHLFDIIHDVLVVQKVCAVNIGVARSQHGIRLWFN